MAKKSTVNKNTTDTGGGSSDKTSSNASTIGETVQPIVRVDNSDKEQIAKIQEEVDEIRAALITKVEEPMEPEKLDVVQARNPTQRAKTPTVTGTVFSGGKYIRG